MIPGTSKEMMMADRLLNLYAKYEAQPMAIIAIAPLGMLRRAACCEVYPRLSSRQQPRYESRQYHLPQNYSCLKDAHCGIWDVDSRGDDADEPKTRIF